MTEILIAFLSSFSILATLIPILRNEAWWIRIFDFPRLQILSICFISLVINLVYVYSTYSRFLWPPLVLSIAYQLFKIYPYTRFAKKQVLDNERTSADDSSISILFANVLMTNRSSQRCREVIREKDPDIILVVEADKWWQKELCVFEQSHPYVVHAPLGNTYGMLFYSRLKIYQEEIKYLLKHDIPSLHCVVELKSGDDIRFYGVHPRPPAPAESKTSLQRDAELILVGKEAKKSRYPVIVAGDLNDVAWSHTTHLFQKISGLLDPRIGRGMFSTFNSKHTFFRWPLDHIFHSKDFRLVDIQRLPDIHSDHFPIFIRLSYEPEGRKEQHERELTADAAKEATEKVEEVKKE